MKTEKKATGFCTFLFNSFDIASFDGSKGNSSNADSAERNDIFREILREWLFSQLIDGIMKQKMARFERAGTEVMK